MLLLTLCQKVKLLHQIHCVVYMYIKTAVEVTRETVAGTDVEQFIEKDKIVAAWCGRFDDINKTHERLEL